MRELVSEAEEFLAGKSKAVKAELARQMEEAAERLDFEQAARYRDRIQAMSFVTAQQGINPRDGRGGGCVRPRTRKAGRPASRCSSSAPGRTGATAPISRAPTRALARPRSSASFLAQFYDDKPVPRLDPAVA